VWRGGGTKKEGKQESFKFLQKKDLRNPHVAKCLKKRVKVLNRTGDADRRERVVTFIQEKGVVSCNISVWHRPKRFLAGKHKSKKKGVVILLHTSTRRDYQEKGIEGNKGCVDCN